jgi:hypothetical protein
MMHALITLFLSNVRQTYQGDKLGIQVPTILQQNLLQGCSLHIISLMLVGVVVYIARKRVHFQIAVKKYLVVMRLCRK